MSEAITLRERVQALVLEHPEQMIIEECERVLKYHGEHSLYEVMRLSDAAFIVAAILIAGAKGLPASQLLERMDDEPRIFNVTLTDGVKTSDG